MRAKDIISEFYGPWDQAKNELSNRFLGRGILQIPAAEQIKDKKQLSNVIVSYMVRLHQLDPNLYTKTLRDAEQAIRTAKNTAAPSTATTSTTPAPTTPAQPASTTPAAPRSTTTTL